MIPGANAPSSVGDLRPLLILVCLLEVMVPLTTALLIVVNCEKDLTSGSTWLSHLGGSHSMGAGASGAHLTSCSFLSSWGETGT